ncbi:MULTISPECIES: DUF397 domain-containing protein [Streptomyces]|uniref:DUF397 domain-containing protein n=1 Tax=Streptomyces tsukubensis (strain DSM 42081 / NBRC 108919 / NRRL 18488 / 9993) TaxID=1114943 RepID=I2N9D2_STRT9|nr:MULTISPECIES: DUF397 domain-containing protein [Streptomyces]AZK97487.1 DUF397 domain-containing protein [Streptomyces tsukubensis]EIF93629.1 hypothetical protein [Streptomyces tsukubensis NRRL18488]MYS68277.1 DUF397 domain-containing protein [Streptomyces sp. SID5473]QKM66565.1 DUF397 domain-containing protein [Streptomyces tsukubensis NRRL18488]TAI45091.1 DUF397 domain-containing protein [Streptomyces tsukubensis]
MSDSIQLTWFKSSYSSAQGDDCVEVAWSKSSYSSAQGDSCVEVGWTKSSHSSAQGDNCVEVCASTAAVHVRDSKDITRPHFTVGNAAWTQFIGYASRG